MKYGLLTLTVLLFALSCKQEGAELISPDSSITFRSPDDPPLVEGEPILGAELENPYDINNMQEAYELITGVSTTLQPTHYYLKVIPVNGKDILELEAFEEDYGYEFETQPIHFKIIADGKEDYVDPAVGDEGFSPEYGAITASDYLAGHFPDIPFQLLNIMYIPEYETRLTFTAFVISGNEPYYEAIEGLCHPDCPSWPECLDVPSLTCTVLPTPAEIPTLDPYHSDPREDFPNYIFDGALGYYGSVEEISGRIPDPPINDECNPPCVEIVILQYDLQTGGFIWQWGCDCDIDDDGGDGEGGPPSGQTEECDCYVYIDDRKPGGKISVEDTQLEDEGVRRIKVKTAPKTFGFIWKTTNTDNNGCWKIDNRYNVKRLKVKAVFKDRVTDRMIIRSLRGARYWNAFLKPVKHKFLVTRTNRDWNSLCLLIEDSENDNSRDEQSYVAATTNNAVHEYYDDYTNMPSPGKIKILIHNLDDRLDAAPMFSEIDQDQFDAGDINNWFLAFTTPYTGLIYSLWEFSKPDVFISFGNTEGTDRKKSTVYHEMVHVSQYAVTGRSWWEEYVFYVVGISLTDQPKPYGDGSSNGSGRAELTEGMAYALETVISDAEYGLAHSLGTPAQANRYLNNGERSRFWNAGTEFIPRGLFFDLFDQNGAFPAAVSAPEPAGISDNAFGFSFENQVQAINPLIVDDIETFQTRLWQTFGAGSGSTFTNYSALFDSYGH